MSAVNEMRKLTNLVKKELPEIKEKLIVKNATHNMFVENPDQKLIFKKITSFFNQFKDN